MAPLASNATESTWTSAGTLRLTVSFFLLLGAVGCSIGLRRAASIRRKATAAARAKFDLAGSRGRLFAAASRSASVLAPLPSRLRAIRAPSWRIPMPRWRIGGPRWRVRGRANPYMRHKEFAVGADGLQMELPVGNAPESAAQDLDGDAAIPFDDAWVVIGSQIKPRADAPAQGRAEEAWERRKKHAIAMDDLDLD